MKTHLLCLLLFLLSLQHSSSQADRQWLILNQKGKSGFSSNANVFTNSLGTPFTLEEVLVPNISGDSRRRNEFFIIYTDGTNTNTWDNPVANNFFDGTGSNPYGRNPYFNPPTAPAYLYLTNRYEQDDTPGSVRARSRSLSENTPINLAKTTSGLLSSSHEVVIGREITLIVDYNQLRGNDKENTEGVYTLEFNGLRPKYESTIYPVDFLDLMSVFTHSGSPSAVYTNVQVESGANSIVLHPESQAQYEYVNLKNNDRALSFGPTGDSPNYYANFTVKHNGTAVGLPLERAILNSYDPNFLQVLSISQESDHYVVKYHLEFENTSSSVAADSLIVTVILPQGFEFPHHIEWFIKHGAWGGDMVPIPNVQNGYKFIFNPNAFDFNIEFNIGTTAVGIPRIMYN